ncbi:unnamed protein product [Lactuca virosa]|uniref:non-specific serine/threonine protein kinase n=1 Tax=Lactuca virosa TaxID=75947 RepID=A0AAU9LQ64_9ASTR|nr:unnamed protein product [Lactuca virosa]
MENGSLFCAPSDSEIAVELCWVKRLNMIKQIAHALAYMHHDCSPPIVHRDISSNNILLNSEMEAFVADFGAATLIPPIKLFGVLALEILGGKHPRELVSSLNYSSRHDTSLENILDVRLAYPTEMLIENEILRVYHVALACTLTDPNTRPTMRKVSLELSR